MSLSQHRPGSSRRPGRSRPAGTARHASGARNVTGARTMSDERNVGGDCGPVPIDVDAARCAGCLACAAVCRFDALRRMPGVWAVAPDPDLCTFCGRCVGACPLHAIAVNGTPRTRRQMILHRLEASLRSTCPRGWSVISGGPGFPPTPDAEALAPDLAVVRTRQPGLEWLDAGEPPVPLVIDLVGSGVHPELLQSRREAYRTAGVPTYWTVDQRAGRIHVQWSARSHWFDSWAGIDLT